MLLALALLEFIGGGILILKALDHVFEAISPDVPQSPAAHPMILRVHKVSERGPLNNSHKKGCPHHHDDADEDEEDKAEEEEKLERKKQHIKAKKQVKLEEPKAESE